MNLVQKDQFVHNILDSLKKSILEKVDRMPEDWDGFEIRQFIADYYEDNFLDKSKLTGSRKKDYINTCNTTNLF